MTIVATALVKCSFAVPAEYRDDATAVDVATMCRLLYSLAIMVVYVRLLGFLEM